MRDGIPAPLDFYVFSLFCGGNFVVFSRKFFLKSGKSLGREEFMAWFNLFVRDMDALLNIDTWRDNILFVMGNEDHTFIKGVKSKFYKLRQGKIKILNKCGHVCNIQKWQEFNEVSLKFMEEIA